jgi:hypothetical protein
VFQVKRSKSKSETRPQLGHITLAREKRRSRRSSEAVAFESHLSLRFEAEEGESDE